MTSSELGIKKEVGTTYSTVTYISVILYFQKIKLCFYYEEYINLRYMLFFHSI